MTSKLAWQPARTAAGLRRGLYGVFAATAFGGAAAAVLAMPSATAAPDPCAPSEVAKTIGTVATSTGTYLDLHPQTNQALTTISQQQAGPQTLVALKTYLDANPQVGKDLQAIQQPLTGLSTQCKLPISMPQLLALLQAAQGQSGLPGGLAGAAQTVAGTQGSAGSAPAPAVVVPAATGPLPGPATTAR
jgi:heme-binding protein